MSVFQLTVSDHEHTLRGHIMMAAVFALVTEWELTLFTQNVDILTAEHAHVVVLLIGIVHDLKYTKAVPNSKRQIDMRDDLRR